MSTRSGRWWSAGIIVLLTLLAYGVLIPRLGFYRDDWYLLWAAHTGGSNAVIALFQSDRPLIGYIFAGFYSMLGSAPLGWHLLALFLRLVANLCFLWLAWQMFPGRARESFIATLLFAVYPGFVSQPNAGVFVIHLLATAASVLSFALTAAVIGSSRPFMRVLLTALALLLTALYLGCLEYMIGLEAARPVLIAWMLWQRQPDSQRPRLGVILRLALPYLLVAGGFAYWRLFLFESTRHATNLGFLIEDYTALPLRSIAAILVETLKDSAETALFAWIVPLYRFTSTATYTVLLYAGLLGLAAALIAALGLRALPLTPEGAASPASRRNPLAVLVGAWLVFAALLPINAAGRNVLFDVQWDRYALPAALGAAVVGGSLITHQLRAKAGTVILLCLVGTSVVVHYFSAAWYAGYWSATRELWWQFIWRAPMIERGTMLLIPASEFAEGYEVYGPANLIYYPDEDSPQIGAEVLNAQTGSFLLSGQSLEHFDRSILVPDSYDQPLIALFPRSDSCLHVLDGRLVELPGFIGDSLVTSVATLSQVDRIGLGPPASARPVFLGHEPAHTWCYYYQKIQLSRQRQDWLEVARLMDEAQAQDLRARDPSEWLAAVEAYSATARLKDARRAASIIRADSPTRFYLCAQLSGTSPFGPPYDAETVRSLVCRGGD